MLKNISSLKIIINGEEHQYLCNQNCTLPDVKEALFQFLKYVGNVQDSLVATQQEQAKVDPPPEEQKDGS